MPLDVQRGRRSLLVEMFVHCTGSGWYGCRALRLERHDPRANATVYVLGVGLLRTSARGAY